MGHDRRPVGVGGTGYWGVVRGWRGEGVLGGGAGGALWSAVLVERIVKVVEAVNGILFSNTTVFVLLATGVLFTILTLFGQWRALTHGIGVLTGKYDRKEDPGAINHFQALSAALSATVGLGNIGGVAVAIALGGPGAVFWMWVVGVLGMALKMTEVTQSMLFRDLRDRNNPHGGPMYVLKHGLAEAGLPKVGAFLGGLFCVTVILSAITGGNMFQAWNVAAATSQYVPGVPKETTSVVIGVILAVVVGIVIIGGIKRIGAVTGRLVPFMCAIYLLAGLYILARHMGDLPGLLVLIVRMGVGLEEASAGGAFLGGTLGSAFIWGVKRALFSSEAGQGSAPIAHAAAKCDEPVREGVVAGLEPFIDTIVVCTVTALVLLATGAWNREPAAIFTDMDQVRIVAVDADGDGVQDTTREGVPLWTVSTPPLPEVSSEARGMGRRWQVDKNVFMIVEGNSTIESQGTKHRRIFGQIVAGEGDERLIVWSQTAGDEAAYAGVEPPRIIDGSLYVNYAGAALTAHAFDRMHNGLGLAIVVIASWLFAISTMISWSYYGEKGVVYLFGSSTGVVMGYRVMYCVLVFVSTLPLIKSDAELDMWTTLGLGAMLVVNIPIMLLFGLPAMKAYHTYLKKLDRGEFPTRETPSFTDVVSGKDVE